MSTFLLIGLMAITTYLTRLTGFAFAGRRLPPGIERFLRYVPVAAFAALIGPEFATGTPELWPRLIAGTVGALVALRWQTLWITLLVGMACYWAAGYLFG